MEFRNYGTSNGNGLKSTESHFEHKLCLLVPFRDRAEELLKFVPHISKFLSKQQIRHSIFVVNQADGLRFNRASLINVGFLHARSMLGDPECDYVGLHDVDLLPLNDALSYAFPSEGPLHVAAPGLHPKYNYPTFVGAILLLTVADFELIRGMSNKYWGWGWEDDELYHRLVDAGLKVQRPEGIFTTAKDTFEHIHGRGSGDRVRDTKWCEKQWDRTRRRDRKGGFRTVEYEIESVEERSVEGHPFQFLDVILKCNRSETPWCDPDCKPVREGCSRACEPIKREDDIRPSVSSGTT